jgi:hypothetical protein
MGQPQANLKGPYKTEDIFSASFWRKVRYFGDDIVKHNVNKLFF